MDKAGRLLAARITRLMSETWALAKAGGDSPILCDFLHLAS
jgi:hypothetical protein